MFGGAPKRVEQEQKILVAVRSCTWTSSPITGSNLDAAATEISALEDMELIIKSCGLGFRGMEIVIHGDFEEHEFIAIRVIDASDYHA